MTTSSSHFPATADSPTFKTGDLVVGKTSGIIYMVTDHHSKPTVSRYSNVVLVMVANPEEAGNFKIGRRTIAPIDVVTRAPAGTRVTLTAE